MGNALLAAQDARGAGEGGRIEKSPAMQIMGVTR